jgi:hypothetical protein
MFKPRTKEERIYCCAKVTNLRSVGLRNYVGIIVLLFFILFSFFYSSSLGGPLGVLPLVIADPRQLFNWEIILSTAVYLEARFQTMPDYLKNPFIVQNALCW